MKGKLLSDEEWGECYFLSGIYRKLTRKIKCGSYYCSQDCDRQSRMMLMMLTTMTMTMQSVHLVLLSFLWNEASLNFPQYSIAVAMHFPQFDSYHLSSHYAVWVPFYVIDSIVAVHTHNIGWLAKTFLWF